MSKYPQELSDVPFLLVMLVSYCQSSVALVLSTVHIEMVSASQVVLFIYYSSSRVVTRLFLQFSPVRVKGRSVTHVRSGVANGSVL